MNSELLFFCFACLICAGFMAPTDRPDERPDHMPYDRLAGSDHVIKCGPGEAQRPYNLTGLVEVDRCRPVVRHRTKRTNLSCNVVAPREVGGDYYCTSKSPSLKCIYYDGENGVSCYATFGMVWTPTTPNPGVVLYVASKGMRDAV